VGVLSISENLGEFCNASQSLREPIGKHPTLPISVWLVESRDMVNNVLSLRILLRTVSRMRAMKSYLSQRGVRKGKTLLGHTKNDL